MITPNDFRLVLDENITLISLGLSLLYVVCTLLIETWRDKSFWDPKKSPDFSVSQEGRSLSLNIAGLSLAVLTFSYNLPGLSPSVLELFAGSFLCSFFAFFFLEKEFTKGLPRTGELLGDVAILALFGGFVALTRSSPSINFLGCFGFLLYFSFLAHDVYLLTKGGKAKTKTRWRKKHKKGRG